MPCVAGEVAKRLSVLLLLAQQGLHMLPDRCSRTAGVRELPLHGAAALLDEAQGCVELVCAGQDWGDVLLPHALVKQRKLGINVPIHAIEVACQEQ